MTKNELMQSDEHLRMLTKYTNRTIEELQLLAKNSANYDYVSGELKKSKVSLCLSKSLSDFLECIGGLSSKNGLIFVLARRIFVINYITQVKCFGLA